MEEQRFPKTQKVSGCVIVIVECLEGCAIDIRNDNSMQYDSLCLNIILISGALFRIYMNSNLTKLLFYIRITF